jgi:hypothetical protein
MTDGRILNDEEFLSEMPTYDDLIITAMIDANGFFTEIAAIETQAPPLHHPDFPGMRKFVAVTLFTIDFGEVEIDFPDNPASYPYYELPEYLSEDTSSDMAQDTKIQPDPEHLVESDGVNRLLVKGYGDAYLAYSPTGGDMYMAGSMPVPQLEGEIIEGSVYFADDNHSILKISAAVSRPDKNSGSIAGPGIKLIFNTDTEKIEEAEYIPFENSDAEYFTFTLEDENALAFGRMLYEAMQICIEYEKANSTVKTSAE